MFDDVPEPVWKTSIGNWSSNSPAATRSAAAAMRSALSSSSSPSSALTRAAAALIRASQRATGTGIGSPETGKLATAFRVSSPQSSRSVASLAITAESTEPGRHQDTRSSAVWSSSSQVTSLTRGRPCGSPSPRSAVSIASQPAYSTSRSRARGARRPPSRRMRPRFAPARRCEHPRAAGSTVSVASFLFVPMMPVGPALDPAGAVDARHRAAVLVEHPPALVAHRRALLVERHALHRDAPVADAAEDDSARHELALFRRHRADPPSSSATSVLRTISIGLDPALAEDRDRRHAEAQRQPAALARSADAPHTRAGPPCCARRGRGRARAHSRARARARPDRR